MDRRDRYLPSNLFLNRLRIGFCKKAKQNERRSQTTWEDARTQGDMKSSTTYE